MEKLSFRSLLSAALMYVATCFVVPGCSGDPDDPVPAPSSPEVVELEEVARMLSRLPVREEQLREVHDAVSSSTGNGYDEEYTMSNLILSPGSGVGPATRSSAGYDTPLRDLISDYLSSREGTKAAGNSSVMEYMKALSESDIQIYWPYSENWDGRTFPVISFDPGYGAETNYGYQIGYDEDGFKIVDSVLVDEALARRHPVWVVNRNDDSAFSPLELFSRQPGTGTKAGDDQPDKVLVLKSFKMLRQYDTWFGGASEFLIKCGYAAAVKANSSDSDLKLFNPKLSEFMLVVKRQDVGRELNINSVIITDFSEELENLAFLITEDDGGTTTSWKCSASVKYASKSYGLDLDIPYHDKDDIVWRGQLSTGFFTSVGNNWTRFGDVVVKLGLE